MVTGKLPRRQLRFAHLPLLAVFWMLLGCHSAEEGLWRATTSERTIELRAGNAYITEGRSIQSVPYKVEGDKIVLHMPFLNTVLQRMPDGSLSGMGETLIRLDSTSAAWLGLYESRDGEYRLQLHPGGRAVYTRLGRSQAVTYKVDGNTLTLFEGSLRIKIRRRSDGSIETPDAVLNKQS